MKEALILLGRSHLQVSQILMELAPLDEFRLRLPRFHWASPSASLDEIFNLHFGRILPVFVRIVKSKFTEY